MRRTISADAPPHWAPAKLQPKSQSKLVATLDAASSSSSVPSSRITPPWPHLTMTQTLRGLDQTVLSLPESQVRTLLSSLLCKDVPDCPWACFTSHGVLNAAAEMPPCSQWEPIARLLDYDARDFDAMLEPPALRCPQTLGVVNKYVLDATLVDWTTMARTSYHLSRPYPLPCSHASPPPGPDSLCQTSSLSVCTPADDRGQPGQQCVAL
jgi:hypothetical protein